MGWVGTIITIIIYIPKIFEINPPDKKDLSEESKSLKIV